MGLEIDFISGMESFTRDLLDSNELEDGLLSIHFLPGKKMVGDVWITQQRIFHDGLVKYYGSVEKKFMMLIMRW
ncbi:hypothetical protein GCM10020331_092130 [Ectobacillus funiculus]